MRPDGRGSVVILVAAALALPAAAPPRSQALFGEPQPVRYALELGWAPSERVLTGRETIVVRNAGAGSLPIVWLRLWPNGSVPGSADGCSDPGITLTRVQGARITGRAVVCSAIRSDRRATRIFQPARS